MSDDYSWISQRAAQTRAAVVRSSSDSCGRVARAIIQADQKHRLRGLAGSGCLLVAVCCFPSLPVEAARFIEVSFTATHTNFYEIKAVSGSNTNVVSKTIGESWKGRCITGEGKWLLTQARANTVENIFFNGTYVLQTQRITCKPDTLSPELIRRLPLAAQRSLEKEPGTNDWISLSIDSGEIPFRDIGAQLPWLAFCSGSYLRKPGRLVPLLGALIRVSQGAFAYRDETQTFTDSLGLPQSVDLRASLALLQDSVKGTNLIRVGRTSAEIHTALGPHWSLPEGFLRARYRVLAKTNLGGWEIPTAITYEEYEPGDITPKRSLNAMVLVDSVTPANEPKLGLSPANRYSVADYRYRSSRKLVDQIHYAITNGIIPSRGDPCLQRLFERAEAAAPFDPVMKVHAWIYAIFAILLTVPIIGLGAGWLRRTRQSVKSD